MQSLCTPPLQDTHFSDIRSFSNPLVSQSMFVNATAGCSQAQGLRDSQEDRFSLVPSVGAALRLDHLYNVGYYAVYDGHLGWSCAEHAQQNLLPNIARNSVISTNPADAIRAGFCITDEQYIGAPSAERLPQYAFVAGTTVTCVLIDYNTGRILVANAGDSRAVLCQNGQAVPLTRDHTASNLTPDERAIVNASGAAVIGTHVWVSVPSNGRSRFDGGSSLSLEVTRALGDPLFKCKYNPSLCGQRDIVSCIPDVVDHQLGQQCEFVVLATDGLFSVLDNDRVVALARQCTSPQAAAELLTQSAIAAGSSDNVTCIVIPLQMANR